MCYCTKILCFTTTKPKHARMMPTSRRSPRTARRCAWTGRVQQQAWWNSPLIFTRCNTQVKFAPHQHSKLISAAVDGLICVFDTDGDMNEDNHLLSVMNVETSVAKVGFFGNTYQKLWCLSHIETLSTWDWNDGSRELNIEDARSLATDRWNLDHVDYFVDCHYSLPDDKLWVIGGTTAGTIGYFPIRTGLEGAIGSVEAILEGGHIDVVRTIYPAASTYLGQNRGIFGWTGGEDGRLCCWHSDEIAEINKSWISSSLVSRVQRKNKSRHQPY